MNPEQIRILGRAVKRSMAFSEIAIKRGENKLAKELDEEASILGLYVHNKTNKLINKQDE